MKKMILFSSVLCLLLTLSSCQKEWQERFGFTCQIEENSSGLTIMAVGNKADYINLNGYVSMQEGGVEITLTDPNGAVVLLKYVEPGEYIRFNETFKSVSGYWKLKYKSIKGIGTMDLHMDS